MFAFSTVAIATLLVARSAVAQTCLPCDDVHFFLARGNNEPYPGRQGALVAATCDGVASCGYENLIYSALFTDLSCQTTYDGCIAGLTQISAYASRCPNSKLILAGYSQGAQIVTDLLGGGGGTSFNGCVQPATPALDRSTFPGDRLSAVIAFGDTRHTANEPYNFGSGSGSNGLFPRPASMTSKIATYSNITRDWCTANDPICAGGSDVSIHLGYYNVDTQSAATWIRSVASISQNDPSFSTSIPTSISGTVQNYATIPSGFIPTGTVVLAAATTAPVSCSGAPPPASSVLSSTPMSSATSSIVMSTSSSVVSAFSEMTSSASASMTASSAMITSASSTSSQLVSIIPSSALSRAVSSTSVAAASTSTAASTTPVYTGAGGRSAPQALIAFILGLTAAVALL